MKIRKSRLPVVVALAVVLLGFAGYGIYRSITLPRVHVTHVAKNWLDNTSGHHHAVRHRSHHVAHHGRRHHHTRLAHHRKKHHARLAHHRKKHHYQTASYAE